MAHSTTVGGLWMSAEDLWFELVTLLSRCTLNEGLLWIWAERVPVDNVYREKNAFAALQDWEYERLNTPPAPEGVRRSAHYLPEERLRSRIFGRLEKKAREYHVPKALEKPTAVRQWLPILTAAIELPA